MRHFMSGYKSYTGAVMMAASAILNVAGMPEHADPIMRFGQALLGAGLAHKLVKSRGVG